MEKTTTTLNQQRIMVGTGFGANKKPTAIIDALTAVARYPSVAY